MIEPGKLVPMEPVLKEKVQNNPDYVYQVKWDGIRIIAFVQNGAVELQTKKGRLKTQTYPELNALAELSGQPLIADGEVVAIKNGRPDFGLILKRNFTHGPKPSIPINYVIFDLLCFAGQDLRNQPLSQRLEKLSEIKPVGVSSAIDNFIDGEALFKKTEHLEWEGIVAKKLDSPYLPGKHPYWYKVKRTLVEKMTVIGYTLNQGHLASLLMAYDFGEGLQFAGAVGSGLTSHQRRLLLEILGELEKAGPVVPLKKHPNWRFVRPLIKAEVEFREWTSNLTARAPVFKKLYVGDTCFELPQY
ncbi:MAG: hypothetical protein FH749_00110 [Firmicutes bacterium]|nr:hypothetical protein [Bacillota bacterium]